MRGAHGLRQGLLVHSSGFIIHNNIAQALYLSCIMFIELWRPVFDHSRRVSTDVFLRAFIRLPGISHHWPYYEYLLIPYICIFTIPGYHWCGSPAYIAHFHICRLFEQAIYCCLQFLDLPFVSLLLGDEWNMMGLIQIPLCFVTVRERLDIFGYIHFCKRLSFCYAVIAVVTAIGNDKAAEWNHVEVVHTLASSISGSRNTVDTV